MKKEIKKPTKTIIKKETDTEMLARLVVNGFDEMKGRFEQVDKRFEQLEKKFDDRCDRIEYLLIRAQDNRLDRLEDKMRRVETSLEIGS